MGIIKLARVGTRTNNLAPTVAFFGDVLGLRSSWTSRSSGCSSCQTGARGSLGPDSPIDHHLTTGPVAGFLVDNLHEPTELRSAGVEILLESGVDDSGSAWVHVGATVGNIYEFSQDPDVSRPPERWSLKATGDDPNLVVVAMAGWAADRRGAAAERCGNDDGGALVRTAPTAGPG